MRPQSSQRLADDLEKHSHEIPSANRGLGFMGESPRLAFGIPILKPVTQLYDVKFRQNEDSAC
jgi:hypothetical protein